MEQIASSLFIPGPMECVWAGVGVIGAHAIWYVAKRCRKRRVVDESVLSESLNKQSRTEDENKVLIKDDDDALNDASDEAVTVKTERKEVGMNSGREVESVPQHALEASDAATEMNGKVPVVGDKPSNVIDLEDEDIDAMPILQKMVDTFSPLREEMTDEDDDDENGIQFLEAVRSHVIVTPPAKRAPTRGSVSSDIPIIESPESSFPGPITSRLRRKLTRNGTVKLSPNRHPHYTRSRPYNFRC